MTHSKRYYVNYSEEDLSTIEGTFARMPTAFNTEPVAGNFLVRPDGIYEIEHVTLSPFEASYDIYLAPVESQCEDGDAILVLNKDRIYKCHKNSEEYGFKRVSMYTLMNSIDELADKLASVNDKLDALNTF